MSLDYLIFQGNDANIGTGLIGFLDFQDQCAVPGFNE